MGLKIKNSGARNDKSFLFHCFKNLGIIETRLSLIGMFGILVSVLLISIDTIMRYIFSSPIPGIAEISTILFVAAIFLNLGYTQFQKGHIRVELFLLKMPKKLKKTIEALMLVVALAILILFTWCSALEAIYSIKINEMQWGAILIPLWPAKIILPIGLSALCIQIMVDIYKVIKAIEE